MPKTKYEIMDVYTAPPDAACMVVMEGENLKWYFIAVAAGSGTLVMELVRLQNVPADLRKFIAEECANALGVGVKTDA